VREAELPAALAAVAPLGAPVGSRPGGAPGTAVVEVRLNPERAAEVNRALALAGVYADEVSAGSDLESVFLALTATAPVTTPDAVAAGWGQRG
jgi:hypothetical protein